MSIMEPRVAGFVSRSSAGLRKPRSVSTNITPQHGGVAVHYGGSNVPTSGPASAKSRWKSWQDYHMNTHGWVDIAYTMGVDNWGFVYAGRGAGVRTAANGTNTGNQNFYAVCWIGGERQTPTKAALSAIAWAINELRESGAGLAVKPHRYFKSTACPGSFLANEARKVDGATFEQQVDEPVDEWEVFWMSLSDDEKRILKDFVSAIEEEGTNARSFVKQLLRRHREDIPALQGHVSRVNQYVELAKTSLQGVIVGSINAIDAVRDLGYDISTTGRTGPTKKE